MSQVVQFPRTHRTAIAAPIPATDEQRMVAAALRSWMDGDPLTEREQRIVEVVLDTNYFGQLGRLVMGA